MYLSKEEKENLFAKHGKGKNDTGSTEGQIALFTHRINHLTKHLKNNQIFGYFFIFLIFLFFYILYYYFSI